MREIKEFSYETPFGEVKEFVKNNRESKEGVLCPCCGRLVKVWKMKLSNPLAMCLIEFYKEKEKNNFIHVKSLMKKSSKFALKSNGGYFAQLSWWGLIEPKKDPSEKRASGYWRITKKGIDFVEGSTLPKYVYIFNKECLGKSEELTNISESLGESFEYKELWVETEVMDGGCRKN